MRRRMRSLLCASGLTSACKSQPTRQSRHAQVVPQLENRILTFAIGDLHDLRCVPDLCWLSAARRVVLATRRLRNCSSICMPRPPERMKHYEGTTAIGNGEGKQCHTERSASLEHGPRPTSSLQAVVRSDWRLRAVLEEVLVRPQPANVNKPLLSVRPETLPVI